MEEGGKGEEKDLRRATRETETRDRERRTRDCLRQFMRLCRGPNPSRSGRLISLPIWGSHRPALPPSAALLCTALAAVVGHLHTDSPRTGTGPLLRPLPAAASLPSVSRCSPQGQGHGRPSLHASLASASTRSCQALITSAHDRTCSTTIRESAVREFVVEWTLTTRRDALGTQLLPRDPG